MALPSCVALALGDVVVSFSLTLVLLIVGFILFYPLFFVHIWRPHRLRHMQKQRVAAYRAIAEESGNDFNEADVPTHASLSTHARLHMDHRSGKWRPWRDPEAIRQVEESPSEDREGGEEPEDGAEHGEEPVDGADF